MAQHVTESSRFNEITVGDIPSAAELRNGMQRLDNSYYFREPDEVKAFLGEHPYLVPILIEAADVIPTYFDKDDPLILEVFVDPEDDDYRELIAAVQTTLGPDEALERLDRLDDEWWLDVSARSRGKLLVNMEYR